MGCIIKIVVTFFKKIKNFKIPNFSPLFLKFSFMSIIICGTCQNPSIMITRDWKLKIIRFDLSGCLAPLINGNIVTFLHLCSSLRNFNIESKSMFSESIMHTLQLISFTTTMICGSWWRQQYIQKKILYLQFLYSPTNSLNITC